MAPSPVAPEPERQRKGRWLAISGLLVVVICGIVWLVIRQPPPAPHETEGRVLSAGDLAAKKRLDEGLAAAITAVHERRFSDARALLTGLAADATACGRQAEVEATLSRIPHQ